MEFYLYPEAMRAFLDKHGLSQNFWKEKDGGINQSAISRYIKKDRIPSDATLDFIYMKINSHVKGHYHLTLEEFKMESIESQVDSYLTRMYRSENISNVFERYLSIAEQYDLNNWIVTLRYDLAFHLFKEDKLEDALAVINECIVLSSIDEVALAKVYYMLGRIYFRKKSYHFAMVYFEHACETNPLMNISKYYLAVTYQHFERYSEANDLLKFLVECTEGSLLHSSKIQLAFSEKMLGHYQLAIDIMMDIETSGPLKVSNLNNIGECYNLLSDYDKANEYYLKALELAKEISSSVFVPLLSLMRLQMNANCKCFDEYNDLFDKMKDSYPLSRKQEVIFYSIKVEYYYMNKNEEQFWNALNDFKTALNSPWIDLMDQKTFRLDLINNLNEKSFEHLNKRILEEILN